ncbi:MAG: formate dehydrogenase [Methylotenera sp. 24-45-7]|jgi:formate dehydrogenase subunit delta|nr:MAG: formate dehydrogenase [Methylophilales bacterium 16-45-9]OYZ40839.1 MAG: formate dehydrogenase [Methylotenera sp. 24-45-7]OZA09540.1 MAG: formate dehydrogenase [Methylotenera sp. 17-45-7]OZA50951.1 MAG: formate dehydrogenase [Methylophilales bacterium 39-45-7]HQS38012.1 formate dehydrogenase subunit delta [Methylotenera sp.]
MDIQRLIIMANQIGDFYESYPDQSHAQVDIAEHLNKFWALPMRKQIAQYVGEQGGAGLHQQVQVAIKNHLHL